MLRSAVALFLLAAPVSAATVTESADFSNDWYTPSVIAGGTTAIHGTSDNLDVLRLDGLAAGAQSLHFTFSAAAFYSSGDYTAGGDILTSTSPFRYEWDYSGRTSYQVSYNSWNVGTPWFGETGSKTTAFDVTLGSGFAGGSLYLAIVPWTGGKALSYDVSYTSAPAALAAVPVPASGLLLGGLALGGLLLRRRRA